MNRRQSGNIAIVIMAIVVVVGLVGAGIFVWARQDKKHPGPSEKTENASEVVVKTKEKAEDVTETVIEVDLLLQHTSDVDQLPAEAPETFVDYIKTKLNDFDCNFAENPTAGISLSKISPRFVRGGIGCMGGAGAVWYLTTAGWEELGYQSMIPCSTLVELAIPSDFMEDCYNDNSPDQETIANPNGSL